MPLIKSLQSTRRVVGSLAIISALLVLLLATPAVALGSASVVSSNPANRSKVQAGLSNISIKFSEELDAAQSRVEIIGPKTAVLPDVAMTIDPADRTSMQIKTRRLVAGIYQVKWTAVSRRDNSSATGTIIFTATGVSDCTDFKETGKSVCGRFVEYWDWHGNLAQQGLPISDELEEKSDTDGKTYKVQYFERAVFELHNENQPPNDVLLSLLGNFRYQEKYPQGALGQIPNTGAGAVLFPETGKHLGGRFLAYWNNNGGLAQQGFPISEEFQEKNDLDGKTYTVQYFERAVFEYHPENDAPYDVLLSQLGTFRYRQKYGSAATATPPPATATPVTAQVTGSVRVADGLCCVGGTSGSNVAVNVAFAAQSTAGAVNKMQVEVGTSRCANPVAVPIGDWEPFVAQKSFQTYAGSGFSSWRIVVRYQDVAGNLSPAYCGEVAVEGIPPTPGAP